MSICRCCGAECDTNPRYFDEEKGLCDECKNITIPMVLMYLAVYDRRVLAPVRKE
jgi:hypothetical protein